MRMRSWIQPLLQPVEHTWFWLILALIIKSVWFIHGLHAFGGHSLPGFPGTFGGDTGSYLQPLENWLASGNYLPDHRMPGLALVYLPLRMFLSMAGALTMMVILQYIVAAVAVYYLAKSVYLLSGSRPLFHLVIYALLLSSYANLYDYFVLPESFCVSATVFFFYFLICFSRSCKRRDLFLSGLFFCWLVFLRPPYILFPFIVAYMVWFMARQKSLSLRQIFVSGAVFLIAFLIVDGGWIVRNLKKYGQVVPLQKTVFYDSPDHDYLEPLSRFVIAFGGSMYYWDPDAEIRWFNFRTDAIAIPASKPLELPYDIYTSGFNRDSLLALREQITKAERRTLKSDEQLALNIRIGETCRRYEQSFREERPFQFYVTARLKAAWRFIFSNGTYNLFNERFEALNPLEKMVKIVYDGFYKIIALMSVLAIFLFPYRQRMVIFFLPVLYTFVLFPLIFQFSEYRYMVPAYPFMVVTACYLCYYYRQKWFTSSKQ